MYILMLLWIEIVSWLVLRESRTKASSRIEISVVPQNLSQGRIVQVYIMCCLYIYNGVVCIECTYHNEKSMLPKFLHLCTHGYVSLCSYRWHPHCSLKLHLCSGRKGWLSVLRLVTFRGRPFYARPIPRWSYFSQPWYVYGLWFFTARRLLYDNGA